MQGAQAETEQTKPMERGGVRGFFTSLGPGIIAGAADDDPSGIATYSIAGAQFGFAFLFTPLFTWPLMAAVQTMCARIGMVTGVGLTGALRQRFRRRYLVWGAAALFIVNTLNIGADLDGMADAAKLLTGINRDERADRVHVWKHSSHPASRATRASLE